MVLIRVDFPKPVWPVNHSANGAGYKPRHFVVSGRYYRNDNTKTRTNDDHVELETTLQELVFNLLGDGVETDVGVGTNLFSGGGHDCER